MSPGKGTIRLVRDRPGLSKCWGREALWLSWNKRDPPHEIGTTAISTRDNTAQCGDCMEEKVPTYWEKPGHGNAFLSQWANSAWRLLSLQIKSADF